jgi:pimeloyl-ACP methyl ester carboxylesterase
VANHLRFIFIICGLALSTPLLGNSINIQEGVVIGGIRQWVSIKGINASDPVLLFLHGGPGNSVMGYGDKFTHELQKHFVVVLWDQRDSGKTAKLNAAPDTLTVDLMERDAVDVINYLRSRFSKSRIYLMGHSWGGFL